MSVLLLRGLNIIFSVLTFAKPECDNVLRPDPQSVEGCNILSHSENSSNVIHGKDCYIVIVIYLPFEISSRGL